MKKKTVGIIAFLLILLLAFPAFAAPNDASDTVPAKPLVYIIPIEEEIDGQMSNLVARGFAEAKELGAALVVLDIDTFGGYVDAAIAIKNTVIAQSLETLAFVDGKAISAGSLIAFSGKQLVMMPGSTIGAAEPRSGGVKADEKALSMWRTELASAAEARGRDGQIAAAMADSDIEIPGLKEKGKLLTLTATQAVELGMADGIVNSLYEAIDFSLGTSDVEIVKLELTNTEKWADFLTSSTVSAILLTIGLLGIVLEVLTPGFGLFGALGLFAFGLFFAGSFIAGYSAWLALFLFLIGLVLIIMEIFVIPGFGVAGISGAVAVVLAVVFASPSIGQAFLSLFIALVATVILTAITLKNKKTRKVWSKLILKQKQENKDGYEVQNETAMKYLQKQGIAATVLRPSGTGIFEGERIDVVTEGEFIAPGAVIEVVKVEGTRVVVKEVKLDKEDTKPNIPDFDK